MVRLHTMMVYYSDMRMSVKRKEVSQIHAGQCGPHMSEYMLVKKILRERYYWLTMENGCFKNVINVDSVRLF